MTVVFLAGGFGTRLRSVVSDRPKCLASVNDRPFLFYLLDWAINSGCNHIVLSLHYQADLIQTEVGVRYRDVPIDYAIEDEPLGTGGGLKWALTQVQEDWAWVVNADSLTEVRLDELHVSPDQAKLIHLVAVWQEDCSRFGKIEVDDEGRVSAFVEKINSTGGGWINAGIYRLAKAALREYTTGQVFSLEKEVFPRLVQTRDIAAWCIKRKFIDIGTPLSYQNAHLFFTA